MASRWKHVYCPDCNSDVIARPISHLVIALLAPIGLWLPILISGGGSLQFISALLVLGIFVSLVLAALIFRFIPLAVRGSQSYKAELALVLFCLAGLVAFAMVNQK